MSAPEGVLVVGGQGEFGTFLRQDLLPALGATVLPSVERDTPREALPDRLAAARHVVLATPLAGYAERACDLVYRLRDVPGRRTLWLIPSVQAGVWRAVTATLTLVGPPELGAVFVHPMYGPNGFRASEPEARTFQNILTAQHDGPAHPLADEVAAVAERFWRTFHIGTARFDPEAHDRITATSQGLSYAAAQVLFADPALDAAAQAAAPDVHHALHANHALIHDFLRLNAYMPLVLAAFGEAWRHTAQATFADLLAAFADADAALNAGAPSPIPTKWYERLRALAAAR